jgi:hypothetical protein
LFPTKTINADLTVHVLMDVWSSEPSAYSI